MARKLLAKVGAQPIAVLGRMSIGYSFLQTPFWWDKEKSGGPIVEQVRKQFIISSSPPCPASLWQLAWESSCQLLSCICLKIAVTKGQFSQECCNLQATHFLDIMRYICGEIVPSSVQAHAVGPNMMLSDMPVFPNAEHTVSQGWQMLLNGQKAVVS